VLLPPDHPKRFRPSETTDIIAHSNAAGVIPGLNNLQWQEQQPQQQQRAGMNLGAVAGVAAQQQQLAVYAATAQAQQAQYLQHFHFWQHMQAQESQQAYSCLQVPPPLTNDPVRFKDNFRPMRLCKHLVTLGFCRQADQCTFAHSFEELHLSSPDLPKLDDKTCMSMLAESGSAVCGGSEANTLPDLRLKKKKELCGRYARGYCSLGKVCSFAHGEDELNTVGLAVCGKVKTQLCRNWEAGRCIYGANCNNAHGEHEIGMKRPPPELAPPSKRRRDQDVLDERGYRDDERYLVTEKPVEFQGAEGGQLIEGVQLGRSEGHIQ